MKAGDSDKSLKSYWNEWNDLFQCESYKSKLLRHGIKGLLRGSRFRSICWKIYLECLPEDHSLWIEETKVQRRRYEEILDKFHTNPRCEFAKEDIDVHNPLTQSQSNEGAFFENISPWYLYFQNKKLKQTIKQDVVRTFPEIEFFQSKDIQKMMRKILFLYAREFPYISYKQGMHELLAPIIFVLHHDHQAYLEASESEELELTVRILLNQNYIEHDAFFLFCKLMETVEDWYTSFEYETDSKRIDPEVFFEESPYESNSMMGVKLKYIQQSLLKQHDPDLFLHLEELEIAPQMYGIRWLRLLFGREFVLHDLLVVWDAIFADSILFDLVNYIFIAMLICIRDSLLESDFASTLTYLMRYPRNSEVRYIIDLALYLRDPEKCERPSKYSSQTLKPSKPPKDNVIKTLSRSLFPGHAMPVRDIPVTQTESRPQTLRISRASSLSSSERRTSYPSLSPESEYPFRSTRVSCKPPIYSFTDDSNDWRRNDAESSPTDFFITEKSCNLPRTRILNVMENTGHKFRAADSFQDFEYLVDAKSSAAPTKEMVPLVPQISDHLFPYDLRRKIEDSSELESLTSELSRLKAMNEYCVHQLSLHVEKLQETMVSQKLVNEDDMFIALAGIKRARDILKGSVSFNQDVIGDDINPYTHVSNNSPNSLEEYLTSYKPPLAVPVPKEFADDSTNCDNSESISNIYDKPSES